MSNNKTQKKVRIYYLHNNQLLNIKNNRYKILNKIMKDLNKK